MRKALSVLSLAVTCFGIVLMTERQAHAYADPGSSLLILQAVGSVVTATGLYFRRRIASLFRRGKNVETEPVAVENQASTTAK